MDYRRRQRLQVQEPGVKYPCYGEYYCGPCNRKWESTKAWRDYEQECTRCRTYVLANKLEELFFYSCSTCGKYWKYKKLDTGANCRTCGNVCWPMSRSESRGQGRGHGQGRVSSDGSGDHSSINTWRNDNRTPNSRDNSFGERARSNSSHSSASSSSFTNDHRNNNESSPLVFPLTSLIPSQVNIKPKEAREVKAPQNPSENDAKRQLIQAEVQKIIDKAAEVVEEGEIEEPLDQIATCDETRAEDSSRDEDSAIFSESTEPEAIEEEPKMSKVEENASSAKKFEEKVEKPRVPCNNVALSSVLEKQSGDKSEMVEEISDISTKHLNPSDSSEEGGNEAGDDSYSKYIILSLVIAGIAVFFLKRNN